MLFNMLKCMSIIKLFYYASNYMSNQIQSCINLFSLKFKLCLHLFISLNDIIAMSLCSCVDSVPN